MSCKAKMTPIDESNAKRKINTHTQIARKGKRVSLLLVTLSMRQRTTHFLFLLFLRFVLWRCIYLVFEQRWLFVRQFTVRRNYCFPIDKNLIFLQIRHFVAHQFWTGFINFSRQFSSRLFHADWLNSQPLNLFGFYFCNFLVVDVLFATCFNLGVPLFTLASRIYW